MKRSIENLYQFKMNMYKTHTHPHTHISEKNRIISIILYQTNLRTKKKQQQQLLCLGKRIPPLHFGLVRHQRKVMITEILLSFSFPLNKINFFCCTFLSFFFFGTKLHPIGICFTYYIEMHNFTQHQTNFTLLNAIFEISFSLSQ